MSRFRRVRALAAVALLALLLPPSTALADCMAPPPIEEAVAKAEIVFVGTVTATAQMHRWATVTVAEVWNGPDQPATVLIKGGPAGNAATSVDRSFEPGQTYLFFPYVDPVEGLTDNSCTSTTPWGEALVALRPAAFRQPLGVPEQEPGTDLMGIVQPVALAVLVGLGLLGAGLLARGRQSA